LELSLNPYNRLFVGLDVTTENFLLTLSLSKLPLAVSRALE
jgi:hypothetical protein